MSRCTVAIALLASLSSIDASANPAIYRCGNSYSQSPCAGGRQLGAVDVPSTIEQAQAERRADDDRRLGERMEQARLRREARLRPALASGFDSRAAATPKPSGGAESRAAGEARRAADKPASPERSNAAGFVAVAPARPPRR